MGLFPSLLFDLAIKAVDNPVSPRPILMYFSVHKTGDDCPEIHLFKLTFTTTQYLGLPSIPGHLVFELSRS